MNLLDCPICEFVMYKPATMSCGHSYCHRCVGGYLPSKCPLCKERLKQRDTKSTKSNVLLISIIEKCYPQETRMKNCIQEKLKVHEFTDALRMANEAMHLAPADMGLRLYRTEANLGLMCFSDALSDLDYLCSLHPNWIEGFFLKGNALQEMGRPTEALTQFHRCLQLRPEFIPAKSQIRKRTSEGRHQSTIQSETNTIMEAEGMAVPEEVPRILQSLSEYLDEPCPVTSVSGSRGPSNPDGGTAAGEGAGRNTARQGSRVTPDASTECGLGLCQEASFPPTPDEDEETMGTRRKEDSALGRGACEKNLSDLSVSDFECPLCIRLFHDPVSTPCGHTFCKNCIKRSLDHNLRCPLCKQPLQEYFEERKFSTTALLQDMVRDLFPAQLADRRRIDEAEMAELCDLTKDVPVFVCTVAYPGVRCPLHIFEPRYRLMMRRCMETGTKRFGMCSYEHGKGFADYGCILEIHTLKLLPDGRSFVDSMGVSRFRVLKRGQRDGYHTADIELLVDLKVEGPELDALQLLHDSVYQQALEWYQRTSGHIRERLDAQYGAMPEREDDIQASSDGPDWCWWLLSVLQLDPAYQTTVLSLSALKDRLSHLRLALEYFSQS